MIKDLFKYQPGISRWVALLSAGAFLFIFGGRFIESTWSEPSFGMAYFWFFLIPMIPLVIHAIYPTKFGWYLIAMIMIVYLILLGHRDFTRASWDTHHVKYSSDHQTGIFIYTAIEVLVAVAFFYFLRPRSAARQF